MWKFIVVILAKKWGNKTAKNANVTKKQNKEPNKATMIFHNYPHHEAS